MVSADLDEFVLIPKLSAFSGNLASYLGITERVYFSSPHLLVL